MISISDLRSKLSSLEKENRSIYNLDLSHTTINSEIIAKEIVGFINKYNIPYIILNECGISDKFVNTFFSGLLQENNSSLIYLSLADNNIDTNALLFDNDIVIVITYKQGVEGLALLNTFLRKQSSVESVDLFGNPFFESLSEECTKEVKTLVTILDSSSSLRSICGCRRNVKESLIVPNTLKNEFEIDFISADLKKNVDIKSLQIKGSPSELENLINILEINRTLIRLKLGSIELKKNLLPKFEKLFKVNSYLRTLQISFADIKSPDTSSSIRLLCSLLQYFESNNGITSLSLDSFDSNFEVFNALSYLIRQNRSLVHLGLFNVSISYEDITVLTKGIEFNTSIQMIHINSTEELSRSSLEYVKKAVDVRGVPLILRLQDVKNKSESSDYLYGYGSNLNVNSSSSNSIEIWGVEDSVEVEIDDDNWLPATIIAISRDFKYTLQLTSGEIISHFQISQIRRGANFQRHHSIPDPLDQMMNDFMENNGELFDEIDNEISNNNHSNQEVNDSPFQTGKYVESRFYGDNMWYKAKVKSIVNKTCITLEFDDEMVCEVNSNMIREVFAENKVANVGYDSGYYIRGDYVEIFRPDGSGWKRGRVAVDKKNGAYDIRMENGSDEKEVRGRHLRFHFRAKEFADCKSIDNNIYEKVQVLSQDKSGNYLILLKDNVEESNVNARRLMPLNRASLLSLIDKATDEEEVVVNEPIVKIKEKQKPTVAVSVNVNNGHNNDNNTISTISTKPTISQSKLNNQIIDPSIKMDSVKVPDTTTIKKHETKPIKQVNDDGSVVKTMLAERKISLGSSVHTDRYKKGTRVEIQLKSNGEWYPATIIAFRSRTNFYEVIVDNEDTERFVPFESIRIPIIKDIIKSSLDTGFKDNSEYLIVGQEVETRIYGDIDYYNAKVQRVYEGGMVVDVILDDNSIVQVDSHFIRDIHYEYAMNNYYDSGYYQRGDYVEIKVPQLGWKRGRVALDRKNGFYDVRMEDGTDLFDIKGKLLRHQFRFKDQVDCRNPDKGEWVSCQVVSQDRNGQYKVLFEDGSRGFQISPYQLMPLSREEVREKSKRNNLISRLKFDAQQNPIENKDPSIITSQTDNDSNAIDLKIEKYNISSSQKEIKVNTTPIVLQKLSQNNSNSKTVPTNVNESVIAYKLHDKVEVKQYDNETWLAARICEINHDGTYLVRYLNGRSENYIPAKEMRYAVFTAPTRNGSRYVDSTTPIKHDNNYDDMNQNTTEFIDNSNRIILQVNEVSHVNERYEDVNRRSGKTESRNEYNQHFSPLVNGFKSTNEQYEDSFQRSDNRDYSSLHSSPRADDFKSELNSSSQNVYKYPMNERYEQNIQGYSGAHLSPLTNGHFDNIDFVKPINNNSSFKNSENNKLNLNNNENSQRKEQRSSVGDSFTNRTDKNTYNSNLSFQSSNMSDNENKLQFSFDGKRSNIMVSSNNSIKKKKTLVDLIEVEGMTIRIGDTVEVYNELKHSHERCIVENVYSDMTFDACNFEGRLFQNITIGLFRIPVSTKYKSESPKANNLANPKMTINEISHISEYETVTVVRPVSNNGYRSLEEFEANNRKKLNVIYKGGTRVEVLLSDNSWSAGVVVRYNTANKMYLVALDGEDNERGFSSDSLRPANKMIENSFDNGYSQLPISKSPQRGRGGVVHSAIKSKTFTQLDENDHNNFESQYNRKINNNNFFQSPSPKSNSKQFVFSSEDNLEVAANDSICFGALLLSEYSFSSWLPLIPYVNLMEGKQNIKNTIYNNTEVNISLSSKWVLFESGLKYNSKRVIWKNEKVSTPFFIKIDKSAPITFPLLLVLHLNSIVIGKMVLNINMSNIVGYDNNFNYTYKWLDFNRPIMNSVHLCFSEHKNNENYNNFQALDTMIKSVKDYFPSLEINLLSNNEQPDRFELYNSIQLLFLSPLRNQNSWNKLCNQNSTLESMINNNSNFVENKIVASISQTNNYEYIVADKSAYSINSNKLSEKNVCFNNDLATQLWIYTNDNITNLKIKFVSSCKSIFKLFSELEPRNGPTGLLFLPANLKTHLSFKHRANSINDILHYSINQSNSLWHLYFISDDNSLLSSNANPSLIEIPFNKQFITEISPLVNLNLSILLAIQCAKDSNMILPFSFSQISRLFDKEGLVTLFNFFSDYERRDNNYSNIRSSSLIDADYDTLSLAVSCMEKALNIIYQQDLSNIYNKVYRLLDIISPDWLEKSNLNRIKLDNKIYWISTSSSLQSWKALCDLSNELSLNESEEVLVGKIEEISRSSPLHLSSTKRQQQQQQLPIVRSAQKNKDEIISDIFDSILHEVGIKDKKTANEISSRLFEHGCNSWDDFLSIGLMFSGITKAEQSERIIHFLQETKLPLFIRAKLTSYLLNK